MHVRAHLVHTVISARDPTKQGYTTEATKATKAQTERPEMPQSFVPQRPHRPHSSPQRPRRPHRPRNYRGYKGDGEWSLGRPVDVNLRFVRRLWRLQRFAMFSFIVQKLIKNLQTCRILAGDASNLNNYELISKRKTGKSLDWFLEWFNLFK